jgi:hypothetical protein
MKPLFIIFGSALAAIALSFVLGINGGSKDKSPSEITQPTISSTPASPAKNAEPFQPAAVDEKTSANFAAKATTAAAMEPGAERETALREAAVQWAAAAPERAEAWAASLPLPAERQAALSTVCLSASDTAPLWSIDMAARNHLGDGITQNVSKRWASRDFASAMQWAENLAPGKDRDALLSAVLITRAKDEPSQAASLIATKIPPGDMQDEAVIATVHQWLLKDPDKAGDWIDQFPEGPTREKAIEEYEGMARYQSQQTSTAR